MSEQELIGKKLTGIGVYRSADGVTMLRLEFDYNRSVTVAPVCDEVAADDGRAYMQMEFGNGF